MHTTPHARTLMLGLSAAGSLALAACGSSGSGTAAGGTSSSTSTSSATSASGGASNPAITVAAASVPGVGTVLVNGSGHTLYLLTSEQGGNLAPCSDDNGCTKVWPDTELPSGTTRPIAGSGIQESMLSTVKGPSGNLYITYAGWPLYTFSGDAAAGQARGQGIVSFGGTWEALSPAGTPVTPGSTTSTSSSSGGSGY